MRAHPVCRSRRTVALVAAACGALLALSGCTADRLSRAGDRAMEAGEFERGVDRLGEAAKADPGNLARRLDLLGGREQAVQSLLRTADQARAAGQYADAQRGYGRVLSIEAGNSRALAGLAQLKADERHAQAVAQAARDIEQGRLNEAEAALRGVLEEDPGLAQASALRARIDSARGPRNVTPRLRGRDNKPVTLQFRDAPTKMVFEVLSRQTGINFIFDKDVKGDARTTIFVDKVSIEQAIELILSQNQLGQQVLAPNMALIYPATPAKQKDYQDHVVRSFYLVNADPKRVAELLKTVLGAKTVFTDERTGLLVMRDTPEAVRMAERLIASIDVAEAEVMLEVEVLEITRSRMQQLGIDYPTSLAVTPTPLAGDPLVLADLRDQDETTLKVSNVPVTVNLRKSVGNSNVLASPRIRARNKEKAKVLIGSRVPTITTATTATGVGTLPISNTQVQYLDVGLTLEVEPTVYSNSDVAIKVNLEVSSLVNTVKVGDTIAYEIGTRHATTLLQLKDGETQILAGLIKDSDTRSSSRIPGLGDIPLLGRLFSDHNDTRDKSEIVLSITPRIVRIQPRPPGEDMEFWYGTESQQRGAPLAAGLAEPARAAVARTTVEPAGAGEAGQKDEAADDAAGDAKDKDKAKDGGRASLRLDGEPAVSVGEEFSVVLSIDGAKDVVAVRSMLRFDPLVLQFVGGSAGNLGGGGSPQLDPGGGRVLYDVGGASINGSGSLVALRFKALVPRPQTTVALQQFAATDAAGKVQSVLAPRPLVVAVTP